MDFDWWNWAGCHGNPTGDISNRYGDPWFWHQAGDRLTTLYFCHRAYLFFDTSDMPDTAKILSGSLAPYVTVARRTSRPSLQAIIITQGVQHKPIITSDYGAQLPYTEEWGRKDIETMVENAYNNFTLNALGLANINLTGETRFCLRGEHDVVNIAPSVGENIIRFHSFGKGAGYRPLLYIYYYPA